MFSACSMELPQLSLMFDQNGAPLYAQKFGPADHLLTGLLSDTRAVGQLVVSDNSFQEMKPMVRRSRFRGLTWDKKERRWRVRINVMGKQHHVGRWG
jgi:hypothetical protein